ncbi:interleukin-13 [Sorex araneus]|uniref:interleukin-13 n=1 Tax=Sorex araneus TaxID=42254 RepID=UPI002433C1E5|nr:interleukin-13 [Sorex araneus]
MAHWLTVVIALTCLGGLTSPAPSTVSPSDIYKELITELIRITDSQAALCNGSMVWGVNLTRGGKYCAALESLNAVSNCSALRNTRKLLYGLCSHNFKTGISRTLARDTKIEVIQFARHLLTHFRKMFSGRG